jgi:uncharacterized protein
LDHKGRAETALLIPMTVHKGMRSFSRIILFSLVAVMSVSLPGSLCSESPLPKLSGPVNDFADALTPPYEKRIAGLAKELLAKTGVSLVIVTMPALAGADPKEYANRLYKAWGISEDNGALILVSVREQKLRIQPGTGLKELLSPARIGEIQDRFMAPLLKKNNYDDGLLNGVVAIAKIIGKGSGVTLKDIEP